VSNGLRPATGHAGWTAPACGALLAAAAVAAYGRTFTVPLLFDDVPSIADNPSIRRLATAFLPPGDSTVGGRPVLNVSLAINHALSGTDPWSYHAANLAIHVLAALVLFGIVRRTLSPMPGSSATRVGFFAALLWELHPLLTESVTYVIQRAESLMGLFYLLTLYCLIRAADPEVRRRRVWYALCVAACLLGMGTKEVMVSAPLIALLYDRTFLAGSFAAALRGRRWVYCGLAATWLVLPFLVLSTHGRNGSAGFGNGVSPWGYALTQLPAIVHYLRLCLWPVPLIFDYGSALAPPSIWVAACAGIIAALVTGTAWALVRMPAVGFLGASFFAILAPSSSVVPVITETMAEHRMYLALVPVVVLGVAAMHQWQRRAVMPVCSLLALALFWATWQRNGDYRSEERLWGVTASALPSNERAQNNYGNMLAREPGRLNEAVDHFSEAIRLQPGYADAHYNLGLALRKIPGRGDDAIAQYRETIRLKPDHVDAHNNLGNALAAAGREPEAIAEFEEALRLEPGHIEAHYNMGNALSAVGRTRDAIAQYKDALRLRPGYVEAHFNLGNALVSVGLTTEAIEQYQDAIRLAPDNADAHYNLGNALDSVGRAREAVAQFEETLRLKPDFVEAHISLGGDYESMPGRLSDAVAQFEEALRLNPDHAEAHFNLGSAFQRMPGRMNEAVAQYMEALRLRPDHLLAHFNLGNALGSLGRSREAIDQYRMALRLKPDFVAALCNLGIALKSEGRIPEAIDLYEEALRLSPDDVTVHLNFAVALLSLPGRTDDAVSHLREVLRLQPGNAAATRVLARISQLPH
jgi:tetratricopeptide (TPR) repeat protein